MKSNEFLESRMSEIVSDLHSATSHLKDTINDNDWEGVLQLALAISTGATMMQVATDFLSDEDE